MDMIGNIHIAFYYLYFICCDMNIYDIASWLASLRSNGFADLLHFCPICHVSARQKVRRTFSLRQKDTTKTLRTIMR